MNDIQNNPDLPWNWAWVSENPNLTMKFIIDNLDKDWNCEYISKNKFIHADHVFNKHMIKVKNNNCHWLLNQTILHENLIKMVI